MHNLELISIKPVVRLIIKQEKNRKNQETTIPLDF